MAGGAIAMKLVSENSHPGGKDPLAPGLRRELVRSASIEVTPRQVLQGTAVADCLTPGTRVYVPFLPKGRFDDTLQACRQLVGQGMVPVPHLPARRIESREGLRQWLARLREAGASQLMLIAGDCDAVAGPFPDTLALLESGLLAEAGFHRLGVAGHPEGHPLVGAEELNRALRVKRDYARVTGTDLWVVTQFAFEAGHFTDWLHRMSDSLAGLPVHVGVAGPTRLKTLIAYAAQCGVGVSARVMRRKPSAARLLRAWTPDGLVHALVRHRQANPQSPLQGIHLFPFGGLQQSADWLRRFAGEPGPAPSCEAGYL